MPIDDEIKKPNFVLNGLLNTIQNAISPELYKEIVIVEGLKNDH